MTAVAKSDWKTKGQPKKKEELGYAGFFDDLEAEQLMQGLKPEAMEDKWFVYSQDGWLYLHRSWTGALIYWLKLDGSPAGVRVVESWVNRDEEEYTEKDLDYDQQMIEFLLRRLLLRQDVPFPIRKKDNEDLPKGVYQHHMTGTGCPEKEANPESFWTKLKQFFRR